MAGVVRKVLDYRLVRLVLEALVLTAVAAVLSVLLHKLPLGRNTPANAAGAAVAAIGIILAWKGCKHWIERGPDTELPLYAAIPELGAGLAGGFALFTLAAGAVAALGGLTVSGVRGEGDLWSLLAMAVISGVFEETLFRGVIFRQLEGLLGSAAALTITSGLFGLAHLANPESSWFAALAVAMEAGILLGAAYMLTRRLWLAIGIHAAWNFTQGWVFGIPVSGGRAPLGLLVTRRVGPDWLTGGAFGLEASVVAMIVATLAGLTLLYFAARRGRVVGWRGRKARKASG